MILESSRNRLVADQRSGAVSQHRLLQPERCEGLAPAHPGGHLRGTAAARPRLHASLASRLLPDQSLLRQGTVALSSRSFPVPFTKFRELAS